MNFFISFSYLPVKMVYFYEIMKFKKAPLLKVTYLQKSDQ